jgi:hypothetical protein
LKLIVARLAVFSLPVSAGTADAKVLRDRFRSFGVHLGQLPTLAVLVVTPEAECTAPRELASVVEPDAETSGVRWGRADA